MESRYEERRHDVQKPILAPSHLMLANDQLFSQLNAFPRIQWSEEPAAERAGAYQFSLQDIPDVSIDARLEQPLQRLQSWMQENSEHSLLFCADSSGRREALKELLGRIQVRPKEFNSWKRSEEHTSELQSRPHLVCRLLLEKKK